MDERDRNKISLWRRFGAEPGKPQARGDGYVGENDFHIHGSMWPSRKGQNAKGPWQVWNVSLQPAQDETRRLVAVPPELLDEVLRLVEGARGGPPDVPALPDSGAAESDAPDDLPF